MANSQQKNSFPEVEVTLTTNYKVMNWNYKIGSQTDNKPSWILHTTGIYQNISFDSIPFFLQSALSYFGCSPLFQLLPGKHGFFDKDLASDASAAPCSVEALEAILAKMKQNLGLEVY